MYAYTYVYIRIRIRMYTLQSITAMCWYGVVRELHKAYERKSFMRMIHFNLRKRYAPVLMMSMMREVSQYSFVMELL